MTKTVYTAAQVEALLSNQSRAFGFLLCSISTKFFGIKSPMLHEFVDSLAFAVRKSEPDFEVFIDQVLDGIETARYDFEDDQSDSEID